MALGSLCRTIFHSTFRVLYNCVLRYPLGLNHFHTGPMPATVLVTNIHRGMALEEISVVSSCYCKGAAVQIFNKPSILCLEDTFIICLSRVSLEATVPSLLNTEMSSDEPPLASV